MRFVFVGASSLAIATTRLLLHRAHEVVIVEWDKEKIDTLAEELDCAFVHGDGSKPAILREVSPEQTDLLLCLTGNDQANIIASLVGRSLGFPRVVTKIEDQEFEHICIELGLEDVIIPARTIGRYLADIAEGHDILELSSMIKHEARILSFVVHEAEEGPLGELSLPSTARVICLYRDQQLVLPDEKTRLVDGDEVVLLTHRENVAALRERWAAPRKPAH